MLKPFNTKQIAFLNRAYHKIIKPRNLLGEMDFYDFYDWLDLGTKEDVLSALKAIIEDGTLPKHEEWCRIYLKRKK